MVKGENWCNCRAKKIISMVFKITDYAEELLNDLDNLTLWPDKAVMQKNWIGKSIGAEIEFKIKEINKKIKIFTTRPDTIYGATFIAISINHHLVHDLVDNLEVQKIKEQFRGIENDKEKIGIPLEFSCINLSPTRPYPYL